jgi:hypothetical protein
MNKNKLLSLFGNAKKIKQELFIYNSDETIKKQFAENIAKSNNLNLIDVLNQIQETDKHFIFHNLVVFKNKCNKINYLDKIPHDVKTCPSLIKAYGDNWFKTDVALYTLEN